MLQGFAINLALFLLCVGHYQQNLGTSAQSCRPSFTTVKGRNVCSQQVIFEERFDTLDKNQWKHTIRISGPEEQEFVVYDKQPDNSYTRGGILYIKPELLSDATVDNGIMDLDGCTASEGSDECRMQSSSFNIIPPVRTAEIRSAPFTFRYGRVEVRAKLPIGDWIVPHVYLKSPFEFYGRSNASAKVTLLKSHGNNDLFRGTTDLGRKTVVQSVNASYSRQVGQATVTWQASEGWDEDFHTYKLDWTPDTLWLGVDNQPKHELRILNNQEKMFAFVAKEGPGLQKGASIPPFEEEFSISLGVSVGGLKEFPDDVLNNGIGKPWNNLKNVKARLLFWQDRNAWHATWDDEHSALQIDSIKVTAL